MFRLSARPYMGRLTGRSSRFARSAGRPHASLPSTQSRGWARAPERARSTVVSAALPSAPSTARPAPRPRSTASDRSTSTASGRWNRLPVLARTAFGLYRSTEPRLTSTPSAPNASAQRTTVPRLPGSRIWSHRTTSRQIASMPWGVTVSARSARAAAGATETRTPFRAAWSSSQPCRSTTSSATRTSTAAPTVRASATAWGPSARKRLARSRSLRRSSRRAERSRLADAAQNSGCVGIRHRVGPGHLDQGAESRGVGDGEVGQDLAIDLHPGRLQAGDEAVVGDAFRTGRGVDPLDPQLAEVTLAGTPVAVGVYQRVGNLLLGLAVEARALAAVTRGLVEHLAPLLVGVDRALDACHGSYSLDIGDLGLRRACRAGAGPSWRRWAAGRRRRRAGECGCSACARSGASCPPCGASACPTRSPGIASWPPNGSSSSAWVCLSFRSLAGKVASVHVDVGVEVVRGTAAPLDHH